MRVLVTGHDGYIGSVMAPLLLQAGHQVTGLDSLLFEECRFGAAPPRIPALRLDVRDIQLADLRGFDAIIRRMKRGAREGGSKSRRRASFGKPNYCCRRACISAAIRRIASTEHVMQSP